MRVRSSALYISLIISMLIVLICGSLLMIAYIYRMQDKRQDRAILLRQNLRSGMQVLMSSSFPPDTLMSTALFEAGAEGQMDDRVLLEKRQWGIFELGLVRSFQDRDTLKRAFLMGTAPEDSLKVFYLADEDRPMSISGDSRITGTAYLPKSGIKAAYVESRGYEDKVLVHGTTRDSRREMPGIDEDLMNQLLALLQPGRGGRKAVPDSAVNSFFNPVMDVHVAEPMQLDDFKAAGYVVLSSDSSILVGARAKLDKVILVAPYVRIADGFRGCVQVVASDSVVLGNSVQLRYPSALMLLKNDTAKFQARIAVGKDSAIDGLLFARERERSEQMPLISIGQGSVLRGELWCSGYAELNKQVRVEGAVSVIRLMARLSGAIYENYLIDVKLDKPALSKYYLGSKLLAPQNENNQLLCWLN